MISDSCLFPVALAPYLNSPTTESVMNTNLVELRFLNRKRRDSKLQLVLGAGARGWHVDHTCIFWVSSPSGMIREVWTRSLPYCDGACPIPHPAMISFRKPSTRVFLLASVWQVSASVRGRNSTAPETPNPQWVAGVSEDKLQSRVTSTHEALGHSVHSPGSCSFFL